MTPASFANPRLIDYMLWTFFEVLCVHTSPAARHLQKLLITKTEQLNNRMWVVRAFCSTQPLCAILPPHIRHWLKKRHILRKVAKKKWKMASKRLFFRVRGGPPRRKVAHRPRLTVPIVKQVRPKSTKPRAASSITRSRPTSRKPPAAANPQLLAPPLPASRTPRPKLTLTVPDGTEVSLEQRSSRALPSAIPKSAVKQIKRIGRKFKNVDVLSARTPSSPTRDKAGKDQGFAFPKDLVKARVRHAFHWKRSATFSINVHAYEAVRRVQEFMGLTVPPLPRWMSERLGEAGDGQVRMATQEELLDQAIEDMRALVVEFGGPGVISLPVPVDTGRRTPTSDGGHD